MQPVGSSAAFGDSIGVNTHMSYFDKGYGNAPMVASQLRSSFIRHIRDGLHFADNRDALSVLAKNLELLNQFRVKMCAVVDPSENLGPITPQLLEQFFYTYGQMIECWEGMNEPDAGTPLGWPQTARQWQQGLWTAQPINQAFGRLPTLACALAAANRAADLGDVSQWCDYANLHPYPAGQPPEPVIEQQLPFAQIMAPEKPVMVTETGYFTGPQGDPAANGQPSVTELAQAKYLLRLLLAHFKAGVKRTYLYELQDEQLSGGWGLVHSDGTEKMAFSAVRNMMSILSLENVAPKPIDLTITGSVQSLLLQQSEKNWLLWLWQDISCYNLQTQFDIINPMTPVTITVPSGSTSSLYAPLSQSDPYDIIVLDSVLLNVPDHPIAVMISQ